MGTTVAIQAPTDYYLLQESLDEQSLALLVRVRAFCATEVAPIINDYWERGEFPFEIVPKLAELNIAGGTIQGYGSPGLSPLVHGLVNMELARGDGSVCTFYAVHTGLAMASIAMLGSEEQRQRWLPPMARLEKVGAFGLTEPRHGSDVVGLETQVRRDGNSYVLSGAKRWIGNATWGDLVIIWARNEEGKVGGYVVEKGTPGFETQLITGKTAKRAVWQAEITLSDVRIPLDNRLANANSFRDVSAVLTHCRHDVAWEALGHAVAAYEAALAYSLEREQFGRPIGGFQLVQSRLATMLAEITSMQTLLARLSQLAAEGKMTDARASLAKMTAARKAREVVADARDLLGGNGILLEYDVARHQADMEAVYTYEGTDSIQSLIVGRDITGLRAFS